MNEIGRISRYFRIVLVAWTLLAILLIVVFVVYTRKVQDKKLLQQTKAIYELDLSIRHWASEKGGIYVSSDYTAANSYLKHIKDRDIKTTSGKSLTLMNPAYILRDLHVYFDKSYGVAAHITSLNPLRPENKPDEWEVNALKLFENKKHNEFFGYDTINGKAYFRYMASMINEKSCLKCHAVQGYQMSDNRGGISVSLPAVAHIAASNENIRWYSFSIFILWLMGVGAAIIVKKRSEKGVILLMNSEENFRRSEKKFRTMFENSQVGQVMVSYKSSKIVNANAAFEKMFNLRVERLIDSSLVDCQLIEKDEMSVILEELAEKKELKNRETEFMKDKKLIYCLLSANIMEIFHDKCIMFSLIDITVQKELEKDLIKAKEKAEEADRLKSAFLANMSHEIRSPMNGIVGFSNLLNTMKLDEEKKIKFTNIIQNNSNQLLNLINDIIDISKIEAGQLKISYNAANINKILKELQVRFELERKSLKKTNVKIKLSVELDDEVAIYIVDIYRLQQVLTNLLNNSLKFTDNGFIEMGYHVKQGYLKFYVRDTGVGISKDKQELIFERFRQAEVFTASKYGGTGLGLTISKGIIDLMGGAIWVESEENVGTTFYFNLPCLAANSKLNEELEFSGNIEAPNLHQWYILVVDDMDYNLELFREYIEETGATAICVSDAYQALEICRSDITINLILLDIRLSDGSGYELLSKIKSCRCNVPVVAQTAYALAGDKQKALDFGFDDYISKPIVKKELYQLFFKFLSKN